MNPEEDIRLKAMKLSAKASFAYIEAEKKHGEAAAVAMSMKYMDKLMKLMLSPEYIAATEVVEPQNQPEQESEYGSDDDEFLEELLSGMKLPCAGEYKACREREVTQADVEAFVQGHSQNTEKISFDDVNFDKEFEEFSSINNENKPARANNQQVSKPTPRPIVGISRDPPKSPPRKIAAQTPEEPSKESDYLKKINSNFNRNSLMNQPPNFKFKPPLKREPIYEAPKPKPTVNPPPSTSDTPKSDFKSSRDELRRQNLEKYGNPDHIKPKPMIKHPNHKPLFKSQEKPMEVDNEEDPLLASIDPELLASIKSDIVSTSERIEWDQIAGLEEAKLKLQESVVAPILRPDIFCGLLSAPKGILLFGPPGTGKTLIGKCIASQSQSTFFSISASSLTSKWIGQSEKMVKALFLYARAKQPSVIFIDEIDSILTKRSENEHESSRRLKTEFLVQLDGVNSTSEDDRVVVIGATNLPQELDDAARRRFTQKLYIPLPCPKGRKQFMCNKMDHNFDVTEDDLEEIVKETEGFSGADLNTLVKEAAMEIVRESVVREQMLTIEKSMLRKANINDFRKIIPNVKPSVNPSELDKYIQWNNQYGAISTQRSNGK